MLGLGWVLNLVLSSGQRCGETSPAEVGCLGLLGLALVAGLWFGIQIQRRRLVLHCPFCARTGVADLNRSEGLTMACPACGEIAGGGLLGWTPVSEKDRPGAARRVVAPVRKMQFHSPWFWGLFGVSVVSAVAGSVIHEFGFLTVFGPLWCFVVGSLLIQSVQTGCLDDNVGPTFRARQPVKFWLRTTIWFLGYCFAAFMPIGYALQERDKAQSKVPAELKR